MARLCSDEGRTEGIAVGVEDSARAAHLRMIREAVVVEVVVVELWWLWWFVCVCVCVSVCIGGGGHHNRVCHFE